MWYIVQTVAGREELVVEKCRNAFPKESYRCIFVPKYMVLKKYQEVWRQEKKILFPGYFFVDTNQSEAIRDVLEGPLVNLASPVCVGDDFVPVYPEEQEFLEALMDQNHTVGISRGNIINGSFDIKEGPLYQKSFCILRIDRHKRLADIDLLLHGKHRKAKVALEIVSKS